MRMIAGLEAQAFDSPLTCRPGAMLLAEHTGPDFSRRPGGWGCDAATPRHRAPVRLEHRARRIGVRPATKPLDGVPVLDLRPR